MGMPLSVLMAIFDDVSTWSAVISEPKKRPGVSVHLEAKWRASGDSPILPEDRMIRIEVRCGVSVAKEVLSFVSFVLVSYGRVMSDTPSPLQSSLIKKVRSQVYAGCML